MSTPVIAPSKSVVATPAADAADRNGARWRRSVGLLTIATLAIGAANYLTSLLGLRLLPAAQFSDFAAGQGLLLVLGTGSFAAVPWAVARFVARNPGVSAARQAMHFGLTASALQAVVLAPIALVVCWGLGGLTFGLVGAGATVMISLLAGPIGFLQGTEQLGAIAGVRSLETAVRVVATVIAITLIAPKASLALLAFPIGSGVALVLALRKGRVGFPLQRMPRVTALALTKDAALLGAVQVLLAMLGALDTVYADAAGFTAADAASYQAAALLARIPLFFSAAVSTAAYTGMAAASSDAETGRLLRSSLRTYVVMCVPFALAYLAVPHQLVSFVVPAEYTHAAAALRLLCLGGIAVGAINVVTTAHQARGTFRHCIGVLSAGVVAQALVLALFLRGSGVLAFAAASTGVCVATLAALLVVSRTWLRTYVPSHAPSRRTPHASTPAVSTAQPPGEPPMTTTVPQTNDVGQFRRRASDHRNAQPLLRKSCDLEVVIPSYNEEARLPITLPEVTRELAALKGVHSRIVIVDNGSSDRTADIVDRIVDGARVPHGPEIVVIGCSVRGKGAAVKRGMITSQAKVVGFVDADLSVSPTVIAEALRSIEVGNDVVIASRRCEGASYEVLQPRGRRLGGWAFRSAIKSLVPGIADSQCGFKMFTHAAANAIFGDMDVTGFAFDVEILMRATRLGLRVEELPVAWSDDPGSTLGLVSHAPEIARDIVRLHRLDATLRRRGRFEPGRRPVLGIATDGGVTHLVPNPDRRLPALPQHLELVQLDESA